MDDKKARRLDFIQNFTIALLSVSAVLLFARTQLYNLGISSFLNLMSDGAVQTSTVAPTQTAALTAPVRVAVSGPYGRYGSVTLTTDDEEIFGPLRSLLRDALESAQDFTDCKEEAFLNALDSSSIYYDFLNPLPLSVLAQLVDGETVSSVSARRLAVASENDAVVLYLWDNADAYLRCTTTLTDEELEETISQYELGNALFALDGALDQYREVAPYSLFLSEEPELADLSVTVPLSDTSQLLTALNFNPNNPNRYASSGGTEEVVVESSRALRIRNDGTVTYTGGGDTTLSIEAAGEIPTLTEAVTGAADLLNSIFSTGSAQLYLESVQQTGTVTTLYFGYQADGVPIRFADGQSAAQVTLTGTAVTAVTLRLRQYAIGETTPLLPLRQALGIAAQEHGAELSIGYIDDGSGTAAASWLAD